MKKIFQMFLCLSVLALMLTFPAAAEELCVIDPLPAEGASVTAQSSAVQLRVPVESPCAVTLTVTGPEGIVYQRSYGERDAAFTTEEIYLKLSGGGTAYQVALQRGEDTRSFTIVREPEPLSHVTGWSAGLPLSVLTGDGSGSATMISGSDGVTTAAVSAAGYLVGQARLTVNGGVLTAELIPCAGVTVESAEVRVATDVGQAAAILTSQFGGTVSVPGQPVSLYGAPAAAVVLRVTVSFAPSVTETAAEGELPGQRALYELLREDSVALPNG